MLMSFLISGLLFVLFFRKKFDLIPKIMIYFLVGASFLTLTLTQECYNRTGFTIEKIPEKINQISKFRKNFTHEEIKKFYDPKNIIVRWDNTIENSEKVDIISQTAYFIII